MLSCARYYLGSSCTPYFLEGVHCIQVPSLLEMMGTACLSSEAFYESERPSLPLDIGQLQVSKICLIYQENLEYGRKRDF